MENKKHTRITPDNYLKYYYEIPYEGTTSQGKPLKKLKNITCPYRGIKIIPSDALRGFERGLKKVKTALEAVELLSTYEKHFLKTERELFAIFRTFSQINPDDNLQNCLQMIRTNCLIKLKLEEFEVLDDVDILSRKLSAQTALKLRAKTTKCRQIILNQDTFKRKVFLNSLDEIVVNDNEKEILSEIKNKALFLPTSESSKNAFVVKYAQRNQTEITRRLFIASTGSIEHIVPYSEGGLNSMGNFLLTCASGNRYRENMSLVNYIKRFPKIPIYCQKYIDDIIQVVHDGGLEGNETYPYKIKERLALVSQGRIMISLSKYKYSKDEAAAAAFKHEHKYDNYKKLY